ncbi:MAG TPA: hypothetical protein VF084_04985 [Nitrososphaeraceae archaeon]
MISKNVGKESLIIDKKYQRDEIINFLMKNPGCSKGDLVRGVNNIVSKRPLEKILQELKRDDLLKIEKEKTNSRAYKLFLCSENILIVLNNQIRDFNQEFKNLLQKVEAVIPEVNLLPFTNKENRDKNFIKILFYEQLPLFILKYLMQCFLLKSIAVWPKIIQKKEIISQLNSLVFTEISNTVSDYSNFYNIKLSKSNIHNENYNPNISEELTKLENNILYFAFFLLICKKKGIAKEFENIVDKIWLINSDVQIYLHPEAIRYNLSYEYGKDDWRKFLKLYRQKIEELKNNKKQKLSDFIDHLNI